MISESAQNPELDSAYLDSQSCPLLNTIGGMSTPPASVDEIVRLARGLTPLEKLKLIEQIAPDLEAALTTEATRDFKRLMSEADADTVAVGHVDDSREAIYTRVPGE
jgi:hypothetical protein